MGGLRVTGRARKAIGRDMPISYKGLSLTQIDFTACLSSEVHGKEQLHISTMVKLLKMG